MTTDGTDLDRRNARVFSNGFTIEKALERGDVGFSRADNWPSPQDDDEPSPQDQTDAARYVIPNP